MAIAYRLDDLGWFEFEQLVQTLAKARLGMGIEAWGGRGDWGRDAYFIGTLQYPGTEQTDGPFVFQCKFVESANAAGAKPKEAIFAAVRQERGRIREHLEKGHWAKAPNCYALLTNAMLTPSLRDSVREIFRGVLPSTLIMVHDGNDICQWIRLSPEVVRSFPQLLSLRDLQQLLNETVHSDIIARSQTAIAMAQAYARAFVPTRPYDAARDSLAKHGFVVLEGPPEMGKTTIARMISLSQIVCGWEAIECRSPTDVLKMYRRDRAQVFLGDDFFGRTEYDPVRVKEWQSELVYVLPRLDRTHWLILTCRAHLLRMAKANLDIADQNHRFPEPGEVTVVAGGLSLIERARILYRHAKAVGLGPSGRELVKRHAAQIVKHAHFTPERIRRLIEELTVEPRLQEDVSAQEPIRSKASKGQLKESIKFMSRFEEILGNPTKQMRISFRRLPECHRWMIFALLEADQSRYFPGAAYRELQARYDALCPPDGHQPFECVLTELTEGFIKKCPGMGGHRVDWIHPSCRDLAIDGLSEKACDRQRFLGNCTESGLALAMSLAGGARGLRELPLLQTESDWTCFVTRAQQLVHESPRVLCVIWESYQAIKKQAKHKGALRDSVARLTQIVRRDLAHLAARGLGAHGYSELELLKTVADICRELHLSFEIDFSQAWADCLEDARRWAEGACVIWEDYYVLDGIADFLKALNEFDSSFVENAEINAELDEMLDAILERATTEYNSCYDSPKDADEASERASGFDSLQKSCERLADVPVWAPKQRGALRRCAAHFSYEAESLWEDVPPELDYDDSGYERPVAQPEDLDINTLFRDL